MIIFHKLKDSGIFRPNPSLVANVRAATLGFPGRSRTATRRWTARKLFIAGQCYFKINMPPFTGRERLPGRIFFSLNKNCCNRCLRRRSVFVKPLVLSVERHRHLDSCNICFTKTYGVPRGQDSQKVLLHTYTVYTWYIHICYPPPMYPRFLSFIVFRPRIPVDDHQNSI